MFQSPYSLTNWTSPCPSINTAPEHQKVQKGKPYLTHWRCANNTHHIHRDIQISSHAIDLFNWNKDWGVSVYQMPEFLPGSFKSLNKYWVLNLLKCTPVLFPLISCISSWLPIPCPLKYILDHSHCISLSYYAMVHTSDTERWAKFRLISVGSPFPNSLWGPHGTKLFTETSWQLWLADVKIKKWRCLSHRSPNFWQELAPCLLEEMSGSKHDLVLLWRFALDCGQLHKKIYFLRMCLPYLPTSANLSFIYAIHYFLKNDASAL